MSGSTTEEVVRSLYKRLHGWDSVLAERADRADDRSKPWLYARHHADLRTVPAITAVLRLMPDDGVPLGPKLGRKVNGFLAARSRISDQHADKA